MLCFDLHSNTFSEAVRSERLILTEGAVVERLRRDPRAQLDPSLAHAAFLYDRAQAALLEGVQREYLDTGHAHSLPMICLTATWRSTPERLRAAGLADRDVNGDACRFLRSIRDSYGEYGRRIFVGGLLGCRGDAYRPDEALSAKEAERFHTEQIELLASGGVDFLFASTLPAASEATGIAAALARMPLPYLLSFVIRADGTLLDGTPIVELMERIDGAAHTEPLGYMVNCVHHSHMAAALAAMPDEARRRILGLQANTSARSHADLDGLADLETEAPEIFAAAMYALHRDYGMRVLGGCCGTDARHIRALACLARRDAV
jgi:homocysteine S-methyltransferase